MPVVRGVAFAGAHQVYGTGKDGVLLSAVTETVSGEKHYRAVDVGSLVHPEASAVSGALDLRCLGRVKVANAITLDALSTGGLGAGAAGADLRSNGGGGGGLATAGAAGGKGDDNGGVPGGAAGAAVADDFALGSKGGNGGCGTNDISVCGSTGGTGGKGGGALRIAGPIINLSSVSAKGAVGTKGDDSGSSNVSAAGGAGAGSGGTIYLVGNRADTGTLNAENSDGATPTAGGDAGGGNPGAGGAGGGGIGGNHTTSAAADGGGGGGGSRGYVKTHTRRGMLGTISGVTATPALSASKRLSNFGVGGGRPTYQSACLAGAD